MKPLRRPPPKWQDPPVHPANNAPLMSDAELNELANDIKAHGMHEPIVLFRDNSEEPNGAKGPFPIYLLDGRNRLEALKRIGINDPHDAQWGDLVASTVRMLHAKKQVSYLTGGRMKETWETDCDPFAFHTSMNVYRRHLTQEQRRELIAARLIENPDRSNRQIATTLGVDDKTVGAVRKQLEATAEIPQSGKRTCKDGKVRKQPTRKLKAKAKPAPETASVDDDHPSYTDLSYWENLIGQMLWNAKLALTSDDDRERLYEFVKKSNEAFLHKLDGEAPIIASTSDDTSECVPEPEPAAAATTETEIVAAFRR